MVNSYLETIKILDDVRAEEQKLCGTISSEKHDAGKIKVVLNTVSVFNQVSPEDMAKEQHKDPILGLVCPYVTARKT